MKKKIYSLLLVFSLVAALIFAVALKNSRVQPKAEAPFFFYLLGILLAVYVVFFILSFFVKEIRKYLELKGPLYAGAILFFNILNIVTAKLDVLPPLYFPSLDRVVEKLVLDRQFLLKCIFYSFRLLVTGFSIGAAAGFVTGVFLGYSRRFSYWVAPITRILGPIPTTAWMPLALSTFPTTFGASVFLIAFTVWFQISLMTSSGIQSINKSSFEVADTLGASNLYQILHIAIPGAGPSIFLGFFYGTCSSFLTLMTAEMVGTSAGIGWYINNQKSIMCYQGVYAGLILIAVLCSAVLTVLFKVRAKVLPWEKGVIKW
ncbi:MAG: ABC transporter permease subunit [Treponemataceae bacterium]|nr:ABC transporter permease subunit [Treponemataceae bacterium]